MKHIAVITLIISMLCSCSDNTDTRSHIKPIKSLDTKKVRAMSLYQSQLDHEYTVLDSTVSIITIDTAYKAGDHVRVGQAHYKTLE